MQYHATFLLQVAVGPEVVVAHEVVHLHAHVGQFGEFAEEARVALGHHVAVFVPEVEHIAEQIDRFRLVFYLVEEAHEAAFLRAAVLYGE